jgi:hypothetical protein
MRCLAECGKFGNADCPCASEACNQAIAESKMPNKFLRQAQTPLGYVITAGSPKADEVPLAVTPGPGFAPPGQDGCVIFGSKNVPAPRAPSGPGSPKVFGPKDVVSQLTKTLGYDDEVERQRRLLCDTALAQICLEKPDFVNDAIDLVGDGLRMFWRQLRRQADDATIANVVSAAKNRIYGTSSFGRRDPKADRSAASQGGRVGRAIDIAQVERWLLELDKKPRDIPKLMGLFDYFYCKVLESTEVLADGSGKETPEYKRAESKKARWRPMWYANEEQRGRKEDKDRKVANSSYPGLLTPYFTIPLDGPLKRCGLDLAKLVLEDRKRGWDTYFCMPDGMNAEFKQSLMELNLPFSASASGTTSTLFLVAEAFAGISSASLEKQKQYLLACVIYLVGGGMHTCHEVFWTGRQVGIPVRDGKYMQTLPQSFTLSEDCQQWSNEFGDIVRTDRSTVR